MPADADLITYLDPLVAETAGTDLVEGPMPESPDNCVVITLLPGESAKQFRVMAPNLTAPGAEVARVQLMVRNTLKATAAARAAAIHPLLDGMVDQTLSGRKYFSIESVDGEPFTLGQDKSGRWRYACSYRVTKARG